MLITEIKNVKEAFPFIQQMLADAFHVDSYYFSYPYQDLQKIDRGFREMIWADFTNANDGKWRIQEYVFVDHYQIFAVESVLGFYNLIAFVTLGENPDFISIGPFCIHSINELFFKKITMETQTLQKNISVLRHFYESLPVADCSELNNMLIHLISAFLPPFESVSTKFIRYAKNERFFTENEEQVETFSSDMAEEFTKQLQFLMETIERGHSRDAWTQLQKVLSLRNISSLTPVSKLKNELNGFNTLFFGRLIYSRLSAFSVCRLWYAIDQKIQAGTNQDTLYSLFHEMIRKYCLLFQNQANTDYSLLTRKMMLYIEEHLAEELSLQTLSDHLGKNASYLSALFKRETGQTVTEYIQQERIRAAIRLFNTGAASVTQVAAAVGISDCCRFSRIFKKQTEMTPSQYRKMMRL